MNKFLHYWTAMAVALSSIAFTACGDDDDEDDDNNGTVVNNNDNGGNENNGSNENNGGNTNNGGNENGNTNKLQGLVGTWVYDEKASTVDIQGNSSYTVTPWPSYTFNADGTFSAITDDKETYEGKYSVDGDNLILEIIDEEYESYTQKAGADLAIYQFGEEAADYGVKFLITKQSISLSGDVMKLEQDWEISFLDNNSVIKIHEVYNRQK